MQVKIVIAQAALAIVGLWSFQGSASAAEVLCQSLAKNHMFVSDAYVSTCIAAGVGNIGQGNVQNDAFLKDLALIDGLRGGYTPLGDSVASFTKSDPMGTFSFNSSLWDVVDELYIGFKFGTGNTPDEWMVYQLKTDISFGTWRFVDVLAPGNDGNARLSHIALYSKGVGGGDDDDTPVPEPGTIALSGLALLGLAVSRRWRARIG